MLLVYITKLILVKKGTILFDQFGNSVGLCNVKKNAVFKNILEIIQLNFGKN